jgi:trimeric autotransporter adhesin
MKKLILYLAGLAAVLPLSSYAPPPSPIITATENTANTTTPGSTLTYTVVISASGADAKGVTFTEPLSDPNLTLVPNSLRATPLARPDSYSTIGNVSISIPAITGVLANDSDPDGAGGSLTVTPFTGPSVSGGTVTLNADGSFTYNPPAGFEGTDTFTYTLNDNDSPNQTDTGTVAITVTGMIWFIDTLAAGGGDGRLSAPFKTLGAFNAVNDGIGNHPAANDNIFIATGSYPGPLTLRNNQKLIGAGAAASLEAITGLTPSSGSAALPATGGTPPNITLTGAGNNVVLAQGNLIRGLNITSAGGTALLGNNFGSLTASELSVTNTAGVAINLNNGNPTVTFTSVTAAGAPMESRLRERRGLLPSQARVRRTRAARSAAPRERTARRRGSAFT